MELLQPIDLSGLYKLETPDLVFLVSVYGCQRVWFWSLHFKFDRFLIMQLFFEMGEVKIVTSVYLNYTLIFVSFPVVELCTGPKG